jgi:hypothetical protein
MVDPDSLNSDPDPAFQVNPDQDLIWIQGFDDQKKKKQLKHFLLSFFEKILQFSYP